MKIQTIRIITHQVPVETGIIGNAVLVAGPFMIWTLSFNPQLFPQL